MKKIDFCYKNSLISQNVFKKYQKGLEQIIIDIKESLKFKYNSKYAFLNLSLDKENINNCKKAANKLKSLNISLFLQIGIGGSRLGSIAVFQALKGIYYNNTNPKIKYYAIDTIDKDLILDVIKIVNQEFKSGGKVALAIITKSGTTTETIANGAIFIDILKSYYGKSYNSFIYAITDKDSELYNLAIEKKYQLLTIEKKVGGRFSIFSPVGLFSLALFDIDIDNFCLGAKSILKNCLNFNILDNPAAISAIVIYNYYSNCRNILDMFLFSPNLQMLGEWYRQLIGESLGKRYDLNNKKALTGITPTVSIGTSDLHSVAQLYLGGPQDKLTTFVNYKDSNIDNIVIPDNSLSNLVSVLKNKDINLSLIHI